MQINRRRGEEGRGGEGKKRGEEIKETGEGTRKEKMVACSITKGCGFSCQKSWKLLIKVDCKNMKHGWYCTLNLSWL